MSYHLPIFPLPSTVLFPRTHMPFHIFEPRYRVMIETLMESDQKLAIAHLREGYETNYFGAPPIFRTMTAARILLGEKLPDGRWNVLVEGIERVVLDEEVQKTPFRIARCKQIPEGIDDGDHDQAIRLMRAVACKAEQIGEQAKYGRRILTNLVNVHQHPAIVCDIIAALLVPDAYTRQCLLDERNVLRRLQLVNIQLEAIIGGGGSPPPNPPGFD